MNVFACKYVTATVRIGGRRVFALFYIRKRKRTTTHSQIKLNVVTIKQQHCKLAIVQHNFRRWPFRIGWRTLVMDHSMRNEHIYFQYTQCQGRTMVDHRFCCFFQFWGMILITFHCSITHTWYWCIVLYLVYSDNDSTLLESNNGFCKVLR